MTKPPVSIMIIDNNTDYCLTLRQAFEDRGFITWTCPGPEMAATIFSAMHPKFILLDMDMEGCNPLEMIDAWREQSPGTYIIVEITVPDVHRLREAIDRGAYGFLIKSHPLAPLLETIQKAA